MTNNLLCKIEGIDGIDMNGIEDGLGIRIKDSYSKKYTARVVEKDTSNIMKQTYYLQIINPLSKKYKEIYLGKSGFGRIKGTLSILSLYFNIKNIGFEEEGIKLKVSNTFEDREYKNREIFIPRNKFPK